MHTWRAVAVALVLTVYGIASSLNAQLVRPSPGTLPTLLVTAPPELASRATQIERLDRSKFANVMRLVGLTDAGPPIQIIVAPEDSSVAKQTAPWISGFANGRASTIVLFPARTPTYPHDSLEALVHHEVAHILISRAASDAPVPRWFHEGLAMAAERSWSFQDHTRVALAIVGARRPVPMLNTDFDGDASAAARAYAVSGAFVRDLLRRHGYDMPGRVLSGLGSGERFDLAFARASGVTLIEAEQVFWRDSWWYQVVPFVTSSLTIWGAIIFLAFVAMRRRARHRAAQRKQWEEEERLEGQPPYVDEAHET